MASFPIDPGAYMPPLSLWRLVEQHVPPNEQDEIKSMLGESIVDQTLELHNEIHLLLEIWQDYRDETDHESKSTPTLAEPPHVRERLVQEICFLADNVREKSLRKGIDLPGVLSRHNPQILDYAEETRKSGPGSARPGTARSPDGRQTPLSPTSQADSRRCLSEAISDDVTSTNKKLNYLDFSEVCSRLKSTLEREMEQLESDIAFLHSCLESEANIRSSGTPTLSREPTITELREERSLLEKELLSSESIPSTPPVDKPVFAPGATPTIKMQNLRPGITKRKPAQTSSPTGSAKATPLRASHNIAVATGSTDSISISSASPSHASSSSSGEGSFHRPSDVDELNLTFSGSSITGTRNTSTESITGVGRTTELSTITDFPHTTESNRGRPQNVLETNGHKIRGRSPLYSPSTAEESSSSASILSTGSTAPSPPTLYRSGGEGEDVIRHHPGSFARRRTVSPGRVKVVPVGSIIDPRMGAGDGGHFIPSPPPSDKPPLPRPSSAERFRKFVLQCRDGN